MVLMMQEFEILCWINYVDQINLLNLSFNVNDPVAVLSQAKQTLWYIAFSTKNLVNKKKVKQPIQTFIQSQDALFERTYHMWLYTQHQLFQDTNELFNIHQLKLRFDRRLARLSSPNDSSVDPMLIADQ